MTWRSAHNHFVTDNCPGRFVGIGSFVDKDQKSQLLRASFKHAKVHKVNVVRAESITVFSASAPPIHASHMLTLGGTKGKALQTNLVRGSNRNLLPPTATKPSKDSTSRRWNKGMLPPQVKQLMGD